VIGTKVSVPFVRKSRLDQIFSRSVAGALFKVEEEPEIDRNWWVFAKSRMPTSFGNENLEGRQSDYLVGI